MKGLHHPSETQVLFGSEKNRKLDAATRRKIWRVVPIVLQDPATALTGQMPVCDEPTFAPDASVPAQILNLPRDLKRNFNPGMMSIAHDILTVRQKPSPLN